MKSRFISWIADTAILICMLTTTNPTWAQIPSYGVDAFRAPPDRHWRSITRQDVDAAYRLLKDNHPGAAPQLQDFSFQRRLQQARDVAQRRTLKVDSYEGYIATLAGFATGMGDKHIWSRPVFALSYPRWPKMIISKRGDTWVVTDAEDSGRDLLGASLMACDGITVDALARTNLGGFRADWEVGAQQVQSAPWLLVDENNPFIKRPERCIFEQHGQRSTVALTWDRIRRENLLPRLKKAIGAGAAGFDVRRVANGYWIGLQDLASAQTAMVVEKVEAQKSELRQAAFVVLDVRGNGGGSSEVGRQIAASLMGSSFVDARLAQPTGTEDCGGPDGAWRASIGNINNLQFLLNSVALQGGPEVKKLLQTQLEETRAARAAGRDFSGSIQCSSAKSGVRQPQPASLMKGRLLLLTDNLCFSSCLIVTRDFLSLGAFHLGQTTDAATHFIEVREQYMPSGYSLFSTLQSVDPDSPTRIGPFEPKLIYDGDIADTARLEAWITSPATVAAYSH